MSCEACEHEQETGELGRCLVRVGKANVEVRGCDEHVGELLRCLRIARDVEDTLAVYEVAPVPVRLGVR